MHLKLKLDKIINIKLNNKFINEINTFKQLLKINCFLKKYLYMEFLFLLEIFSTI